MTCPLGISTLILVSGTRSDSTDSSGFLTNMPVAPESAATSVVFIFNFLEIVMGGSVLFSVIKLQFNKSDPIPHLFLLFLSA